jgi:hypothetical protein
MIVMERCEASHLSSTMAGLLCLCLTRRLVAWAGVMEKTGCDKEPSAGRRSRRIGVEAALCPLWSSYSSKEGCLEQKADCPKGKKSKGLKLATALADLTLWNRCSCHLGTSIVTFPDPWTDDTEA